jgi:ankyrin repeat protein
MVFLAGHGGELDRNNNAENTPHHLAAATGNLAATRVLLEKPSGGFDLLNQIDQTPIEVAAANGFIDVVEEILRHGGEVSLTSTNHSLDLQRLLIRHAIIKGDVEKLRNVLQATNGSLENDEGSFHLAVLNNAENTTLYLLEIGCPVRWAATPVGTYQSTVLQLAIENKCEISVSALLGAEVPVEGKDEYGWTCLHSAAKIGNARAARCISERISSKDLRDSDGWSALDLAWDREHQEIFSLLHSGEEYLRPFDRRRPKYYPGCPFSTPPNVKGLIELFAPRSGQG